MGTNRIRLHDLLFITKRANLKSTHCTKISDLVARRTTCHQSHQPKEHSARQNFPVDAILYAVVPSTEEEGDDERAKRCQEVMVTTADEAIFDNTKKPMRWGNSQGLSIFERLTQLECSSKYLRDSIGSLQVLVAEQQKT